MSVSSIVQTKAEVQKLIKLYNQLQQEAKTVDTEEASRKAVQAEKLMSQINTLQSALNKTTKIKNSTELGKTSPSPKISLPGKRSSAEDKRVELEKRINRIEDAQKRTRLQIEQLNKAKAELSNLQNKAEAVRVAVNEHRPKEYELDELKKRVRIRDDQYQSLQKELDGVRKQTQQDSELLRKERDTAMEKQKQLEKDNLRLLRQQGDNAFAKGIWVGGGFGLLAIVILAVVIFKTAWLDEVVCKLKDSPVQCSFLPAVLNQSGGQKTQRSTP